MLRIRFRLHLRVSHCRNGWSDTLGIIMLGLTATALRIVLGTPMNWFSWLFIFMLMGYQFFVGNRVVGEIVAHLILPNMPNLRAMVVAPILLLLLTGFATYWWWGTPVEMVLCGATFVLLRGSFFAVREYLSHLRHMKDLYRMMEDFEIDWKQKMESRSTEDEPK
jgi:hypothetical protein